MIKSINRITMAADKILTNKDIEKLKKIQKSIAAGDACTYDKAECLKYLESIIEPKCCVCRKPIQDEIEIIRDHKMHPGCRKRYRA